MGRFKHGHKLAGGCTAEYRAWCHAKARCYNRNDSRYADYGGRHITMCKAWKNSFETFLSDMGPRPDGTSLDRIDNDGDYEPINCRWANKHQQARNKRNNVFLESNGQRMTLSQWAEKLQTNSTVIRRRIIKGWPIDKALTVPVKKMPRQDHVLVTIGNETKTFKAWVQESKIPARLLLLRLNRGWTMSDALGPYRKEKRSK